MRRPTFSLCAAAVLAASLFAQGGAPAANPRVNWEKSPQAAAARARALGKPVLMLHLFGKLNEEFC